MKRSSMGRLGLVGGGVGMIAGLVGCDTVPRSEFEAVSAERDELRERLANVQANAGSSMSAAPVDDTVLRQLEAENADLAAALEQMRSELAARPDLPTVDGATVSARGSDVVVTVAGDVLFNSGSAELRNDSKRTLDNVVSAIRGQFGSNTIRVEGYSDSDPIRRSKWSSNEALSFARAYAVEQYLVSKGIDNDRVYSAAFGPSSPRATKEQSRRVEIVVLGGLG